MENTLSRLVIASVCFNALPVFETLTTKRLSVDPIFNRTREWYTKALEFRVSNKQCTGATSSTTYLRTNGSGKVFMAHIADGVLITGPVGSFDLFSKGVDRVLSKWSNPTLISFDGEWIRPQSALCEYPSRALRLCGILIFL